MQFASQLAERMRAETCSESRNSKQVLDEIKRMEEAFRTAHSFATSETGAGIEEAQGRETRYYELPLLLLDPLHLQHYPRRR
jgi:hypothetical protein